jgi:cell division protein FtsB
MKKGITLLSILGAFVGLALLSMVNAGEKHVITVEENVHLTDVNHQLKCSNDSLVKENKTLTDKNNQLTAEMQNLSDSVFAKQAFESKKKLQESEFLIALHSLEKIVDVELEWISPEALYQALNEKMPRRPTEDEYKQALEDMLKLNLLYHYVKPDPYMKGAKVKKSEINKLVKEFAN